MPWVRGLAFTLLVPFMVGILVPRWIAGKRGPAAGWLALTIGLGEEPGIVVERGLYGVTRNPMYVGVLTANFGQALLYGSWSVAAYGVVVASWLHVVVTRIEEPHLRGVRGAAYAQYSRRVPRWLWR